MHRDIGARQRELLRWIAEYDRRRRWAAHGCRDMAQWLSGRLGITNWAAQRWLSAAYALEGLPLVSEALVIGTLSLDKVVELTRFATAADERRLIAWARRVSAAAIRARAARALCEELEPARDAERDRRLRWWCLEDGRGLGIEAELPLVEGKAVVNALRRVAERLPELPIHELPPGFERTADESLEERCADALYVLACGELARDAAAERATVVVRAVASDGGWAELADGCRLHPEIARRLACDGRLRFVLTDADGDALGIGHTSRAVPAWLMAELRFRDHGCTFPGCGTRAWLQAHHIVHWEDGGPTELHNLVLLCHFHHKLVHEFEWRVVLSGGLARWYRPDGRLLEPGPSPPLLATA